MSVAAIDVVREQAGCFLGYRGAPLSLPSGREAWNAYRSRTLVGSLTLSATQHDQAIDVYLLGTLYSVGPDPRIRYYANRWQSQSQPRTATVALRGPARIRTLTA
jgi:hypothetical protein